MASERLVRGLSYPGLNFQFAFSYIDVLKNFVFSPRSYVRARARDETLAEFIAGENAYLKNLYIYMYIVETIL